MEQSLIRFHSSLSWNFQNFVQFLQFLDRELFSLSTLLLRNIFESYWCLSQTIFHLGETRCQELLNFDSSLYRNCANWTVATQWHVKTEQVLATELSKFKSSWHCVSPRLKIVRDRDQNGMLCIGTKNIKRWCQENCAIFFLCLSGFYRIWLGVFDAVPEMQPFQYCLLHLFEKKNFVSMKPKYTTREIESWLYFLELQPSLKFCQVKT